MAQQVPVTQSAEPFEFVSFEDPEHLKTDASTLNQSNSWIDPNVLKLMHRIGRGPFGDVWTARHHFSTREYDQYQEVAVKMLYHIKEDEIPSFMAKFDEAFQKIQGLQGVCYLYGITIKNGNVCIAMKFYEGSVGDKIACFKGGRLELSDVLRYGSDLAQGIMELHSRGILILDLKPCNFLLNEHDQAIVGDFGILSLLHGIPLPNSDLIRRLGTPNYMAPEQWEPDIRGPVSYETDSWGFGCSVVEMLCGDPPWYGMSPDKIYRSVVTKQKKPKIPSGLPPTIEDILSGCFEYDLRNRPLMGDILYAFKSCKNVTSDDSSWAGSGNRMARKGYTDWSLLKDNLQVADTVRSRKARNSCKLESMEIPEGNIIGGTDQDGFVLVRVRGAHTPLRVHSSTLERVTNGFAAGDCVKVQGEDKNHSLVGILHSVNRDGNATAAFIGMETLWKGNLSELQMARSLCAGQFVRLKEDVPCPRFEWPCKVGGAWTTGRIWQVLPNGCLIVEFPGRLVFGEAKSFLADPAEVELVSFNTCEGMVKKYQHLEDFHWAVRPLVIAFGVFTAVRVGAFVGKSVGRLRKKGEGSSKQAERQQQDGQSGGNTAWLPPPVANILFREGTAPAAL